MKSNPVRLHLALLAVVFMSSPVFAQGSLEFSNLVPPLPPPILAPNGTRVISDVEGHHFVAELLAGLNTNSLSVASATVDMRNGFFMGGTVAIPFAAGGDTIWCQVAVWDFNTSTNLSGAEAQGLYTLSSPFSVVLGGGGTPLGPPAQLLNFPSITLQFLDFGLERQNPTLSSWFDFWDGDAGFPGLASAGPLQINAPFVSSAATGFPPTNALTFQWHFNGADIPGGTGPYFRLPNLSAEEGGAYSVTLSDNYADVPSGDIRLSVLSLNILTNAQPPMAVLGLGDQPGANYRIETTTNLADTNSWIPLAAFTLTNGPFYYTNQTPGADGQRFYRSILLP